MAQKTFTQGAARTGISKTYEAKNFVEDVFEDVLMAEVSLNPPPDKRQEYPEVNAAIERGLADVAAGRVHARRSYAEYADIEIED